MHIRYGLFLFALAAVLANAGPAKGLVWQDEFNGPANSPPDASKWDYDFGAGGWGNQELETYTNLLENVYRDGRGHLMIRAIKSPSGTYTSGRIKTMPDLDFEYGRIEARIKISHGQGLWPAFWMLGKGGGWPGSGEIDIMENIGKEPDIVHGTVHGPGYSGAHGISAKYELKSGRFANAFHIFRADWEPNAIRFYVDGHMYSEITPANLPPGTKWVFDHPFEIILNLAVGGDWPGNPDATTTFPQTMLVDWVRVWR